MVARSQTEEAIIMIPSIASILDDLRPCFSRQAAFEWFVIIIFGLIIRCDHLGITSIVRWLFLSPDGYDLILHFFRATSWQLDTLLAQWAQVALHHYPLITFAGRALVLGDGIKVGKEARRMPAVKTLHQESDNSAKAPYIRGHHFGVAGLLVGLRGKAFCLPLRAQLHEGIEGLRSDLGWNGQPATVVTRMAHLVVSCAQQMGCPCYVALDAYFATGPAFGIFQAALNDLGHPWVHLITRAKDNYVAYFEPGETQPKFQDKDKVYLMSIFRSPEIFEEADVMIYGEYKKVAYYCANFLWKPVDCLIRFVWVIDGDHYYVLMCSDLQLCPTQIIAIYSYRWKIEVMFFALKHWLGGFCYHFWTKAVPKLKRGETLDARTCSPEARQQMAQTLDTIERFVNLAGMALGLLQYLALTHGAQIWQTYCGWLRTYSSSVPSEAVVQSVVRAEFFSLASKVPDCRTLEILLEKSIRRPVHMTC
jgi:hypothetical protein